MICGGMTMTIQLNVHNETDRLETVVVGLGRDIGTAFYQNNPKIQEHVRQGTLPSERSLVSEIEEFVAVLQREDVTVYRPHNLPETMQIFTRDIAFVIGDRLVKATMKRENRRVEYAGISHVIDQIDRERLLCPPAEAFIEGGDVILYDKTIFVGLSDRTNPAGANFLRQAFPEKEIIILATTVTNEPQTNILHLDCAFQPLGSGQAIFYPEGFSQRPDAIYDLFGERNLICISNQEMVEMFPNIFSLSPDVVISEQNFTRLNSELRRRGFTVIEVPYANVSKLGGLLRCSTLPLRRQPA